MSQIKLKHSGGNGVIIAAPDSNPASDRTLKLPSDVNSTIDTLHRAGNILQVLENVRVDASSHSVSAGGDFNPTFLRQSITTTGSNKVIVEGFLSCSLDVGQNWIGITLRRDSSDISGSVGVASGNKRRVASTGVQTSSENMTSIPFTFLDSPSAGTHEYHLQITHGSGGNRTLYINRTTDDPNSSSGCRSISVIRVKEVAV